MQRIFWFGRRGISENTISGLTNQDNDAWLGSYLWNRFLFNGVITKEIGTNKWNLNINLIKQTFKKITVEIDQLAHGLPSDAFEQDEYIEQWMKSKVSWDNKLGYQIPSQFKELLDSCYEIPEQPHFHAPFQIKDLREYYFNHTLNQNNSKQTN